MLNRAKRASHIDPPPSSYAIMRRACPYRGENPAPGKDAHGELDPTPGIRERPRPGADSGHSNAVQPGLGDCLLYSAVGSNFGHELVNGGQCSNRPLTHPDRHLHDIKTSGQHMGAWDSVSDPMSEVQVLAVDIGISLRKRIARCLESARHRDDLGLLYQTAQHRVWCTSLFHG